MAFPLSTFANLIIRYHLKEIENVVKKNHNKTIEFTKLAEAEEYRKSVQLEKKSLQAV